MCRRVPGGRAVATLAATASAALALTVPSALAVGNGDVLSSEAGAFYLDPLKAIKVRATAHRIMYRTTDRTGKVIAFTGTVLNPATSPFGQRPIIAFAPGTQALRYRPRLHARLTLCGSAAEGGLSSAHGLMAPKPLTILPMSDGQLGLHRATKSAKSSHWYCGSEGFSRICW